MSDPLVAWHAGFLPAYWALVAASCSPALVARSLSPSFSPPLLAAPSPVRLPSCLSAFASASFASLLVSLPPGAAHLFFGAVPARLSSAPLSSGSSAC